MKFVAHRGESQAAPENSLESFTLAWSRGVRCVEGDFHLTKDEVIICMHDTNAKRTCRVDRELEDMTLAEIKALDCGNWKSQDWKYTSSRTGSDQQQRHRAGFQGVQKSTTSGICRTDTAFSAQRIY